MLSLSYSVQCYTLTASLRTLLPETLEQTSHLTQQFGWVFCCVIIFASVFAWGRNYTGIEAVSNNVQSLA